MTTQASGWASAFKAFLDRRALIMLFLGFSAGIPILLIFSSLSLWLGEAGIDKTAVTFFSWAALGYSFKLPGISYIKNMDIGVFGRNLFLWTDIPHIDPESSSFGTGNAQGVSRFAFPSTRSFGINFKVQF